MASTVVPIWPGSASFAAVSSSYYVTGSWPPPTPFGFYDNDSEFKIDANTVSNFCALHLGYPIENIELQEINFFIYKISYIWFKEILSYICIIWTTLIYLI